MRAVTARGAAPCYVGAVLGRRSFGLVAAAVALTAIGSLASCAELKSSPITDAASADGGLDAAVSPSPFETAHTFAAGPHFNAIWGVDDDTLFIVGNEGVKYGAVRGQWLRTANAPGRDYLQVWGTKATEVYAVGRLRGSHKGVIERFDGDKWTDEFIAPTELWSVWGDGQIVLAVGPDGRIYGKESGTKEWAQRGRLTEPEIPDFVAVTGNGRSNLTLLSDKRVYHTNNYGDFPWFEPSVDQTSRFMAAWGAPGNETNVFIGMNHLAIGWMYSHAKIPGALLDAGNLIEPDAAIEDITLVSLRKDESLPGSENYFIRGVFGRGNKVFFAGDVGTLYSFDLLNTEVEKIATGTHDDLRAVWASDKTLWVVGAHELLLRAPLP